MTKPKYIPVALVMIFLLTSCLKNPYNDLKYYYGNYKVLETDDKQKDFSFLLKQPVEVNNKKVFGVSDINCDTIGEITNHDARSKLLRNIVLNGFYLYSSSVKVINQGNAVQPKMLKPGEYYSQIDTEDYRFFVYGEMVLVPGVRSFIVSENEKDRYCEVWLINTTDTGEIISATILSKYKEYNGSCFITEKVTAKIKSGRTFDLSYESSAFPTDAAYKNLRSYKKTFRLRLKITDTGELVEK
jgi:hypothetical protein